MSYQITGKIVDISDTQQVNDKFKKREFVIETVEEINGNAYSNFAKFQAVQAKCDILDRFAPGQDVTVNFNIKGSRWEKDGKVNYITNLDAWKIEPVGNVQQRSAAVQQTNKPTPENVDDLPF